MEAHPSERLKPFGAYEAFEKSQPAFQNLPYLPSSLCMAQKMGARLAKRKIL